MQEPKPTDPPILDGNIEPPPKAVPAPGNIEPPPRAVPDKRPAPR